MVRTKSYVIVQVIDSDRFNVAVKVGDNKVVLAPTFEVGLVCTNDGTYLLNSEGVGSCMTIESAPEYVPVYEKGKVPFLGSPLALRIAKEDLPCIPFKGPKSLDTFIRSGGERLESNYQRWQTYLSSRIKPPFDSYEIDSEEWLDELEGVVKDNTPDLYLCSTCNFPTADRTACSNCKGTSFKDLDPWEYIDIN
jgi:hypothetical protein